MFSISRGATARLAQIGQVLKDVHRLPEAISRAVEGEVMPALQEGFIKRQDPYGVSWPLPKAGNPPLERTGTGRRSYQVIRSRRGARWVVLVMNLARAQRGGAYYMGILQAGWVLWRNGRMQVPRRQVPDTRIVPPRWSDRFRGAARRADRAWRARLP